MEKDQLRVFYANVDAKIEVCDQRINLLKKKPQSEVNSSFKQNMNQATTAPFSIQIYPI